MVMKKMTNKDRKKRRNNLNPNPNLNSKRRNKKMMKIWLRCPRMINMNQLTRKDTKWV